MTIIYSMLMFSQDLLGQSDGAKEVPDEIKINLLVTPVIPRPST